MDGVGYFGAGKFFRDESMDELKHYQTWVDFVNARGDIADVPLVPAQMIRPSTLMEAFGIYYAKEVQLGNFYNDWYMECDDATIHQQLITFVEIQRISVGEAGDFLATLTRCMENPAALLIFDGKLNG